MNDLRSSNHRKPEGAYSSLIGLILAAMLVASAAGCRDGKAEISLATATGTVTAQSTGVDSEAADTARKSANNQACDKQACEKQACEKQACEKQASEKGATKSESDDGELKARDIVPESVISPGIERLSYISPKLLGIRHDYSDCLSKRHDQEDCAEQEWQFQDARMNTAYRLLLSKSAPAKNGRGPELVSSASVTAAQRAWLDFMNSNCAAKALRLGSSRAPATQRLCEMQMTAYRAQELEDWLLSVGRQLSLER